MWWHNAITKLPGAGIKRASELEKLGIKTWGDLLYFYPRQDAYLDYSRLIPIRNLATDGTKQVFGGEILRMNPVHRGNKSFLTVTLGDDSGFAELYLFAGQQYLVRRFRVGDRVIVTGSVKGGRMNKMAVPEVILPYDAEGSVPGILPVYSLSGSLTQNMLRKWVQLVLEQAQKDLPESLPVRLLGKLGLLPRLQALQNIHFPENRGKLVQARRRLIFEELFLLQCGLLYYRQGTEGKKAFNFGRDGSKIRIVLENLPYKLTAAQQKAWEEIAADLQQIRPMHRILQGDVGSGKTVVAALALAKAAENGYQSCIMAPTEILARQHLETLQAYLAPAGIKVALLVGGMRTKERQELLEGLAAGQIDVLVGTHALLQEDVVFQNLALAVTDEQHRFGVEQRAKLGAKTEAGVHTLVMTATPIPRTLALTVYGDLDVSRMEGRPPGRKMIRTLLYGEKMRLQVYGGVRHQAELGHQVYVVCPLVEDSEVVQARSAEQVYEELSPSVLRGISTGLIHGKMKGQEKEQVMADFARGKIKVLFSTTVIEVGVNVPNATLMVVENAERFGLAQLHQLRGRVGRGGEQSFCALLMGSEDEEARRRLELLTNSDDGFYLAEQDLRLRGSGQLFGLRQHGLPDLHLADILRDTDVIIEARRWAKECMADPQERQEIKELVEMQLDERFQMIFNS